MIFIKYKSIIPEMKAENQLIVMDYIILYVNNISKIMSCGAIM